MRVLVTGSSGFIGRHLVSTLRQHGHEVVGLDIKADTQVPTNYPFWVCDINDSARLRNTITEIQPATILHLAARIDLDGKQLEDYSANTNGVANLIDAIRSVRSVKRCIFTSSQLVCPIGYIPKHEQDFQPNTLYGESKVMTEKIVREQDGGDIEWCIVRPTTIWGPGMSSHYQMLFRSIKKGYYFHTGNKPLYKSYGYVGNTVHQYLQLMVADSEQIQGKVFYLADYEPLELLSWINAFQRGLKARPVPTVPIFMARVLARAGDMIGALARVPFNSFRLNNILTQYQLDVSNTKEVCGPLPHTVEQGIQSTLDWLINDQSDQ